MPHDEGGTEGRFGSGLGGAMKRLFLGSGLAGLLLLGLSACSWLPVPYSVDLRDRLGPDASGSAQHVIGAGEAGNVDFRHPDGGECIDFGDTDIPATVESARLHYAATLEYSGPPLTGRVSVQLHLSRQENRLWLASNKVGPQVTVNLDRATTRLAGTAVLNREQVEGINDRYLCWGIDVSGSNVSATESGTATLEYTIEQLKLDTRVSLL